MMKTIDNNWMKKEFNERGIDYSDEDINFMKTNITP